MATAPFSFTLARELGQCAADALADTTAGPPGRECLLVPGDIADDGCDCGQLAVTVPRWYGARVPPTEIADDGTSGQCGLPYLCIDVIVRIMRCAPVPKKQGTPPSCAALQDAALIQHEDAMAVRRAVGCCLASALDDARIEGYVLRATESAGPSGACVGSQLRVTFWVPWCNCPQGFQS